jgi:uncharacterized protein (DUF1330 family)
MPKGYWIALVDVLDADRYKQYAAANQAPFREYGARYLARAGTTEVVEGEAKPRRVIIEFPSYEAALACYNSAGYQSAKGLREGASVGDIIVLEGYEGEQP